MIHSTKIGHYIIFLLAMLSVDTTAQTYTISGYLKDGTSKEILIGGSVYDSLSNQGTASNVYGFYSLTLPQGEVSLEYSYVGYLMNKIDFELTKDTVINIDFVRSNTLQEVSITASRSDIGVKGTQMSTIEVPISGRSGRHQSTATATRSTERHRRSSGVLRQRRRTRREPDSTRRNTRI